MMPQIQESGAQLDHDSSIAIPQIRFFSSSSALFHYIIHFNSLIKTKNLPGLLLYFVFHLDALIKAVQYEYDGIHNFPTIIGYMSKLHL